MAVPTFEQFILPLLCSLEDGQERRTRDLRDLVFTRLNLSEEDREQMLPSGQQKTAANRLGWARTALKKAGLIESPRRGILRITEEGRRVLLENPTTIDSQFLLRYPSFAEYMKRTPVSNGGRGRSTPAEIAELTPEERLEEAHDELRRALAEDLLDQVRDCSPRFFEELVVQLLVAMGYGGALEDAGRTVGRSGDGGIDGIIKEDRLGLDFVCIQAKRWQATVGRPIVQAFAGSMEGFRARKGVLITTSNFSKDAEEYVRHIERRIVLIDGLQLAKMMIDFGVGVSTVQTFELKRIDTDFFSEEDD